MSYLAQGTKGLAIPLAITLLVAGCNSSDKNKNNPPPVAKKETTEIQWTSYGVPHIKAENYLNLGKGLGYVMAKDRFCNNMEGIITAKGQRAKYLGAGDNNVNINSDFAYLHLRTYEQAQDNFQQLDSRVQDLMRGFAKGFNHNVSVNKHYAAGCENMVQSIDHIDVYALGLSVNYWAFINEYIQYIGSADPESTERANKTLLKPSDIENQMKGSNGWAIGKSMSDTGKGMILSNTHLPHGGKYTWYEAQLTIPGQIDAYGGFLPGFMTPALGFNDHFSWTHTWTNAIPGTLYHLTPTADTNLAYVYGDSFKVMSHAEYQIEVKQGDGSLEPMTRTLYNSHYGPIVSFTDGIVTLKDAPTLKTNQADYWLKLSLSKNVEEAVDLNRQGYRTGSQNIMMADSNGDTFYADLASVPDLSDEAWDLIAANPVLDANNGTILDGSNPVFEWHDTVPFNEVPQRRSDHYVQNANESAWLVNMENPITNYSRLYGKSEYLQSPRTRLSVAMAEKLKNSNKKVKLEDLQKAMDDKRLFLAEHVADDLVARCQAYPNLVLQGTNIDLTPACDVLANWDKRADMNSVGTHLFREYALHIIILTNDSGCNSLCWETPFSPQDPINTPSGLPPVTNADEDLHLMALAQAYYLYFQAGLDLDAPLSDIQNLVKGDKKLPIAGGYGDITGSFSTISVAGHAGGNYLSPTGLNQQGYEIDSGDGFVYLSEFTSDGINARSVVLYSQSNNPASPHYFDQAELIEGAQYKPVRFKHKDITGDANYRLETLEIK